MHPHFREKKYSTKLARVYWFHLQVTGQLKGRLDWQQMQADVARGRVCTEKSSTRRTRSREYALDLRESRLLVGVPRSINGDRRECAVSPQLGTANRAVPQRPLTSIFACYKKV